MAYAAAVGTTSATAAPPLAPLPLAPTPTAWALVQPLGVHHSNGSGCSHPAGESANGYTAAAASLLGGGAALLPMLAERCLRAPTCARVRDALMVAAPLALSTC